jgi:transposase
MSLKPQERHVALRAQRAEQQSAKCHAEYQRRAGVEATRCQGWRVGGLRQSRQVGRAKTARQHILMAVALNLRRLVAWGEERPLAPTRRAAFAKLVGSLAITPVYAAARP